MDSQDQARVFERVQERVDVGEITPEFINEFLRNRSGSKTYTWQENKRGKLITRKRTVNVEFSSKKDAIARDMGEISKIYREAQNLDTFEKVKQQETQYDLFNKRWSLTSTNRQKVGSLIGQRKSFFEKVLIRQERARTEFTTKESLRPFTRNEAGITPNISRFASTFDISQEEARQIFRDRGYE